MLSPVCETSSSEHGGEIAVCLTRLLIMVRFICLSIGSSLVLGTSAYLLYSGHEWSYRNIVMPLVRLMDPEKSHRFAVKLASWKVVPRDSKEDSSLLHVHLWNKALPNPIGMAAGFDKHGEAMEGLFALGFGFVEVGSVTPRPQKGNDRPRVFRLHEDDAIINRYGFNSHGIDIVKGRLQKWHQKINRHGNTDEFTPRVLGVNLGKNKETLEASDDYVWGVRELGPFASYLVINVSSPNTPGLRNYQKIAKLKSLVAKVSAERDLLRNKPLLVKIAPDLTREEKVEFASFVTEKDSGVDGLIVTNTTVSRPSSLKSVHATEVGGLSGEPLRELATETVSEMYLLTKGEIPIIGVGGVSSGKDAYEKICAGASLVQLYSSLVIHGPTLVPRIKRELEDILKSKGYKNVQEAVGSRHKKDT